MDGLRWIPMNSIGLHSTNKYRWIPSDNISALSGFNLTSGTLSRQTYFTSVARCYEQNFSYCFGKLRFPSVCIGNVWQKVDI